MLRVPTMTDDKMKQKAMEAVADIYGEQFRFFSETEIIPFRIVTLIPEFQRLERFKSGTKTVRWSSIVRDT